MQNTRKLIGEDKVDAIIGSTTTPNSLAMIDVFAEGETPMISLASSARIIEPVDAKRALVVQDAANRRDDGAAPSLEHTATHGVKTLGYIGFSDALGEAFFVEIEQGRRSAQGITIVANERFAPHRHERHRPGR